MVFRWGVFSSKSTNALKIGWLIAGVLVVLYFGFIEPRERERGIAMEKSTGLAAVAGGWEPISLWRQASIFPSLSRTAYLQKGASRVRNGMMAQTYSAREGGGGGGGGGDGDADRRMIRTATLGLIVQDPAQSAERIVQVARSAGGFLASSQVSGDTGSPAASLTIRVPETKFDEVRLKVRQLALRVETEGIEAQDVTRQYVDQEARLRNLHAEERQYLGILGKATTVKDTLEVSGKLNEVRGAIEEKQAEFAVLSKQVETVAINITLRAEADAQVFGLHWRPLYQLKIAAREGLEGLGGYVASMTALVFYLPTIVLWLFTILVGAAVSWRILKWAARTLFRSSQRPPEDSLAQ